MSSEEDFSAEEDPLDPLRSQLSACLDGIHSAGSFATSDHNIEHIPPGLVVRDVGLIRFPLHPTDAEALIRVSNRAPFGKGRKTLVDETVRKTWEIDAKDLSFENKGWAGWLDRILDKVAEGLGVPGGARDLHTEPHKLLIYEEGAFFKPHRDTEKTNNMFGTLVICLPSQHVGGGVRLVHGKEERVLDTDKWSYGVSYLAWYSDVSHEVLPVQSGYRIVLTYNLVNATPKRHLSAAVLNAERSKIDSMLNEWYSQGKARFLCYVLQHKYAGASLQLRNLKGDDYYRCSQLDAACQASERFCVLLSRLERIVTKNNGEDSEEEGEDKLCLNDITTLRGITIQQSLMVWDECLAQRDLYENRARDEQWGGEYVGNQHAEISQVYHDAVVLVVSLNHVTEFLLSHTHSLPRYSEFLQRLLAGVRGQDDHDRQLLHAMILQTCQKHIDKQYNNHYEKDLFLGPTAVASLHVQNLDLAKAALHAVTGCFDPSTFQDIGRMGFQKSKEFSTEAFSRISTLHLVDRGLRAYRSGVFEMVSSEISEQTESPFCQWAIGLLCNVLASIRQVSPKDAGAVLQIVDTYENERLWKSIHQFIDRFLDDATFANALLAETICYSKTVQKPDLVVQYFLPRILEKSISSFQLAYFSSLSKSKEDYPISSWPDSMSDQEKGKKDAAAVAYLYCRLMKDDFEQKRRLLEKISEDTAAIPEKDLDRFIMPLLCEMIDLIERHPFEDPTFLGKTISTYIQRVVQKEPAEPSNWSRKDDIQKCYSRDCTLCPPVREFFESTSQEDKWFAVPRVQHYDFGRHLPFYYNTFEEKDGEDYRIKVTKSSETWERKHKEWRSRFDHAQSALRSLKETPLRQCLGDSEYQDLVEMRIVRLPSNGGRKCTDAGLASRPELKRKRTKY